MSVIFRIFVSSTFSDMLHERDALRSQLFSRLHELCLRHGARFQAIDLRWGVSEAAAQSQRTMEICLEEIARCRRMTSRPTFVALLGDRYGWCPVPSRIDAAEFERLRRSLDARHMGSSRELLDRWFRRDDNANPPEFVLRPQAGPWDRIEAELSRVLREASADLDESARWKYVASATEQEIRAGILTGPRERGAAFAFVRAFRDLPLEHARAREFVDLDADGTICPRSRERLLRLRKTVFQTLGRRAFLYEAGWRDGDVTTGHIPRLVADAYRSLEQVILRELREKPGSITVVGDYIAHESFGRSLLSHPGGARFFVGRERELQLARRYLLGRASPVLVVHGPPGVGKSAFLAAVAEKAGAWRPEAAVVVRFVGATPGSSDPSEFLYRLCVLLSRVCNLQEKNVPRGYGELVSEIRRRLKQAPAERPIILILDGLEHFHSTGSASGLEWLPTLVPEGIKLIVSATTGKHLAELRAKLGKVRVLELRSMGLEEGRQLLELWLVQARRTLRPRQREQVLQRFSRSGLPLLLRLAFEEARLWRSFERATLAPTVRGMIGRFLRRLERPRDHGRILVERSLLYIAASRDGLGEDELLEVLSGDPVVLRDFRRRSPASPRAEALPDIVWSQLYFDLEPYFRRLGEGVMRLDFRHRQFRDVVGRRYGWGAAERRAHGRLARFFEVRARPDTGAPSDEHALSELPYQLAASHRQSELKRLLMDFDFLHAKGAALGPARLIEDFALLDGRKASPHSTLRQALARGAHALEVYPAELPSQLFGRLWNERSKRIGALLARAKRSSSGMWLRPLAASLLQPAGLLRTLTGHRERVNSLGVLPGDRRLISGSNDNTIRLWDLDTGIELHRIKMGAAWAKSVTLHPDGKVAASGSSDGNLYLWEVDSGAILDVLPMNGQRVWPVAFSPDGRRVIAGVDQNLQVWDVRRRRRLRTLEGHSAELTDVAVAVDTGRIASIAEDGTVRVWPLRGAREKVIRGEDVEPAVGWKYTGSGKESLHPDWDAQFVALTPDGQFMLAARRDQTVRVRKVHTGAEVAKLQGHDGAITSIAISKDGKAALTGSHDNSLKLWDFRKSRLIRTVGKHSDGVTAVAFARGDRWALSGSDDATIRIWDLKAPTRSGRGPEHPESVRCLAVTASRFISASEDGTICLWDARTGTLLHRFRFNACMVEAIATTPDGRHLILHGTGNGGPETHSCNLTGKRRFRYLGRGGEYSYAALSVMPDGKQLIAAHWLGADLYDLSRFRKEKELSLTSNAFCTSADGRWVLAANRPGIRIVPVDRGEPRRIRCGDDIWRLALTRDRRRIAGGLRDGSLRIWDARSHRAVNRLPGHGGAVVGLEFSPDGTMLLSASMDRTVHCRDVETGELRATFTGESAMTGCRLSPDGRTLIAGESNGRVHVLRLERPRRSVHRSTDGRFVESGSMGSR